MKERKIGGIDVATSANGEAKGIVIGVFAAENCGKTKLALSGPGPVGFVPLELKAYPTIEKDGDGEGVEVVRPGDPAVLLVNQRKVNAMVDDKASTRVAKQQEYYARHVALVEEYTYGLLESDEIRLVCLDKFTTYCNWAKFAINGMAEKYTKIQGKVYIDNSEVNQHIIDFVNSLDKFGKPVLLNCASKPDYDGPKDGQGNPTKRTWDGFKYLGSHANLVVELVRNDLWDPEKNGEKYDWHYKLNINRSQHRPELEGPDGMGLLKDEAISLPKLMKHVLGSAFDPDQWMS